MVDLKTDPLWEDLMSTLGPLGEDLMTTLDHLEANLENIQGHLGADQTTIEDHLEEDQRINQDHSEEYQRIILDLSGAGQRTIQDHSEAGQIIIQDHLGTDRKTTRVPLEADPAIPHLGIPSLEDPRAWDLRVRFEAEGKTIPVPDSSWEVPRQRTAFETGAVPRGTASRVRIRRRSGPDPGPCSTPTSGAGPPSCPTSSFRRADRGLVALAMALGQGLGCVLGPEWVLGQGLIGGTRSTPRASTLRAPRGAGSPWSNSRSACAERSR